MKENSKRKFCLFGRKHKYLPLGEIKKTVVCKPYEEVGLIILDVHCIVARMKLRWLRSINVDDAILKTFVLSS